MSVKRIYLKAMDALWTNEEQEKSNALDGCPANQAPQSWCNEGAQACSDAISEVENLKQQYEVRMSAFYILTHHGLMLR